jgi:hypothetical protein
MRRRYGYHDYYDYDGSRYFRTPMRYAYRPRRRITLLPAGAP